MSMSMSPVAVSAEVAAQRPMRSRTRTRAGPIRIGISRSLLPRVREPFQTTKAESGGMGLGLYVSSLLAERMGGSLAIDNAPGGGARATLTLRVDA